MAYTGALAFLPLLVANQGPPPGITDTGTVSLVMSIPITSDSITSGQPPQYETASEIFEANTPVGAGWAFSMARKVA